MIKRYVPFPTHLNEGGNLLVAAMIEDPAGLYVTYDDMLAFGRSCTGLACLYDDYPFNSPQAYADLIVALAQQGS